MFDYLKKAASGLKGREPEPDSEPLARKPKKDKVFIIILIVFAAAVIFNIASGFGKTRDSGTEQEQQTKAAAMPEFRFGIFDGIVLAGSVGGYVYFVIIKKNGGK